MAITYTWKLTRLQKKTINGTPDVVFQTWWIKTGTDDSGNTGEFHGATPITLNTSTGFTSYSSLTEEQVLGWIIPQVTGNYEDHVNQKIADQIDLKANPHDEIAENELPWATPETVDPMAVVVPPPNKNT
jgi:hypothetical protein